MLSLIAVTERKEDCARSVHYENREERTATLKRRCERAKSYGSADTMRDESTARRRRGSSASHHAGPPSSQLRVRAAAVLMGGANTAIT